MIVRQYQAADKDKCIEVFQSNFPKYFDKSELNPFINWLDHQVDKDSPYQSPTYAGAEKDEYYVVEIPDRGVVGCGGFYIAKEKKEARLAWGMIHSDLHKKGYGTALYLHRKKVIETDWPNHRMVLGTSQHTYPFYEKMGMTVTEKTRAGYGPDLDKYDMAQK